MQKKYKFSEESRKRISEAQKKRMSNPEMQKYYQQFYVQQKTI